MDDKTKELVRSLNQPHRVANMLALFKMCEQAATLIQAQVAEIDPGIPRGVEPGQVQQAHELELKSNG